MKKAFTLVEIAVVLVIIGFLVGGVLVGQDMIRSAELQDVLTDVQKIDETVASFRERYLALPGDMDNATDFWGEAGSGTACYAVASTGTETCNGDGNGFISNPSGTTVKTEMFRFWQHLANGEFVSGTFTGVAGGGDANNHVIFGAGGKEGDLDGSGYSVLRYPTSTQTADYWGARFRHVIVLGGESADNYNYTPVLTYEDAVFLDTKIDDGEPGKGRVLSHPSGSTYNANCATSTAAATATYDSAQEDNLSCSLYFGMNF